MSDTNTGLEQQQSWNVSLREVVMPLFHHKRAAITVFCAVLLAVILGEIFLGSNYYRAQMQVLVEQNRSDPAVSSEQNAAAVSKAVTIDQVTSEIELLQGTDMLHKVVKTCGLIKTSWSPGDMFRPSDPKLLAAVKEEAAVRTLGKRIKVLADTESDVITVKYADFGAPEIPACVLQTLATLYMEKHVLLSHPSGSSDVFSHETDDYKKKLDAAEAQLIQFGKTENVAAPDVIRTAMAQQVTDMQTALSQAKQQVSADTDRIRYVQEQMKVTPQRSPTLEQSNAANLLRQTLQSTLLAAQAKHADLLTKYDPSYPSVKESEEEIRQTQAQIREASTATYMNMTTDRDPVYELLREDLAKTQVDRTSQAATATALQGSLANTEQRMVKMDEFAVRSAALQREAKAAESNYLLFLSKREQEKASNALDVQGIANVAIATPATVPALPAFSISMVLALGFVFAIICAISAAYVFEYFDPSFSTPNQITELLGIPVMASFERGAFEQM